MTRTSIPLLLAFVTTAISVSAQAHISLDSPKSRYYQASKSQADQTKLKVGPCGAASDKRTTDATLITTFQPGQTVTVKWTETIQHPGHYRIAFDSDGQDFTFPGTTDLGAGVTVLADNIADKSSSAYSMDVTLPNIECQNCTLQLVQVMTTSPPPYNASGDLYFNCADIVLKAGGGGGSGGTGSAGSANGGSSGKGGAGGTSTGGAAGALGAGGAGGLVSSGSGGAIPLGGATGNGGSGVSGGPGLGGAQGAGGALGSGGAVGAGGSGSGGLVASGSGGASNVAGGSAAGSPTTSAGSASGGAAPVLGPSEPAGCSCRVSSRPGQRNLWLPSLVGLALLARTRRQRQARRRPRG